jgi:membrane-associated phospholipid phosphatase
MTVYRATAFARIQMKVESTSAISAPHERPGGARRLLAGTMTVLAALLAPGTARAAEPPTSPTVAATATAAASAAPSSPPVAKKSPQADSGIAGPVERAHHFHAERPPPSAFNPRAMKVRWDESWPKFRLGEYITTGLAGALVFAARAIPSQPDNWRDVSAFDAKARSAIRLGTPGARNTADDASDLVLALMVNQLVIDATLVAWWGHDRPSVGYEMMLIDLEALAVTGSLQALVSTAVSRWRPYRDSCVGPKEDQPYDCQSNSQYTSFWSGHTSGAFTVAGLMCMHHAHLPLYGGGMREVLTCAGSFAAAATVGYLRMAADQHFLTDVLVGAAIGTMSGLGIPWLLHYRGGAKPRAASQARASQVSLRVLPTPMGLAASGEF